MLDQIFGFFNAPKVHVSSEELTEKLTKFVCSSPYHENADYNLNRLENFVFSVYKKQKLTKNDFELKNELREVFSFSPFEKWFFYTNFEMASAIKENLGVLKEALEKKKKEGEGKVNFYLHPQGLPISLESPIVEEKVQAAYRIAQRGNCKVKAPFYVGREGRSLPMEIEYSQELLAPLSLILLLNLI